MESKYVYNGCMYVITNHAVASNPMFHKSIYCKRFLEKVDKYLSPFCYVMGYSLNDYEFQLVVKLKSRPTFIKHYRLLRKARGKVAKKVPHSSYIFSQVMANLQSSLAVYFNWKEKRSGALFARRFQKIFIDGEEACKGWLDKLDQMKKIHVYTKKWSHGRRVRRFRKKFFGKVQKWFVNSGEYYLSGDGNHRVLSSFKLLSEIGLQGHLKKLLPKQISRKEILLFLEIRHNITISNPNS